MNLTKIIIGILAFFGTVAITIAFFSIPFWLLWNWLVPTIFGLKSITFLQAVGLLFLFGFAFNSSKGSK